MILFDISNHSGFGKSGCESQNIECCVFVSILIVHQVFSVKSEDMTIKPWTLLLRMSKVKAPAYANYQSLRCKVEYQYAVTD